MLSSKYIGSKIAEARKKLSLSQAELSQQVSISPQAVGKWERGESMPDITMLNKLTAIFKVDLNYFSDSTEVEETRNITPEKISIENQEQPPMKKFDWNWDMSGGNWVDADFSGLKDLKEKFNGSNMKNCKFIGSELSGLLLKGNNINTCDFTSSDLRDSNFEGSYISKSNFTDCSFIDGKLTTCEISNSNLSKGNFSGTEFLNCNFKKNTIDNTIWKHTSFKNTSLADIRFNGTLEDCVFEHCAFSKVTFNGATLKNSFFKCKTLKNIKFVDCQADKITYEFLKNGKAHLTGLTIIS
jgi:uncharacterized protein YjbI with pentapeptide repeats